MSGSMVERVAEALVRARRERCTVDAQGLELPDAGAAYEVQARVARALDHECGAYWKSGGPSRDTALTHAALPPQGVRRSPADLRDLHFNVRLVEAEVALRLSGDVDAQAAGALAHDSAASLVDAMCVSVEIVDSRWRQGPKDAPALLKLADLQSHGALVLGDWVPYVPRDWERQVCRVHIGDNASREFTGTHSLGNPAWLLPLWLRHATRAGAVVRKGTVVTTGTWCGMLPAQAGDEVRVVFEGIGEARLQL